MTPDRYFARYLEPCRACDDAEAREARLEASAQALVAEAEAITRKAAS